MYNGNRAKLEQNPSHRDALINSGHSPIIFRGSTAFWNEWNGLVMERIRAELRNDGEKDRQHAEEIRQKMDDYAQQNRKH